MGLLPFIPQPGCPGAPSSPSSPQDHGTGYIRLIPPLQSSPPEVQAVSSPAVSPQFLQVTVTMWGRGEVSKWITSCQLFFIEFRGETNLLVLPRPLCKASPWPRSLRFSASILLCALGSFPNRCPLLCCPSARMYLMLISENCQSS